MSWGYVDTVCKTMKEMFESSILSTKNRLELKEGF